MRPRIKRKSVDVRIIKAMSELYEISYRVVRYYYYHFGGNTQVTKLHLNRIYQTGNELSIIN
jgi:hypothetical protein